MSRQRTSDARADSSSSSLAALLAEYDRQDAPKLNAVVTYFAELPTLEEAIRFACHGKDGKIDPHQHLVGKKRLERARVAINKHATEIEEFDTFEQLIDAIESWTRPTKGFGVLADYDTALRLGAYLELLPEAVYVHAGTRAGCKALAIPVKNGKADLDSLPPPLNRLAAHHAENFLCIFKDRLQGASRRRDSRC